jgi:hypothetical protein
MRLLSLEETRIKVSMLNIQRKKSKYLVGLLFFAAIFMPLASVKADTTLSVQVCQIMQSPTFSLNKNHLFTTKNKFLVSGKSGESAMVHEAIYRNGTVIYDGDSLADGEFRASIPLEQGMNTIAVISSDSCGNVKSTDNLIIEQSARTMPISDISILTNTIWHNYDFIKWIKF